MPVSHGTNNSAKRCSKEYEIIPSVDANSQKFCKVSDFFVWKDVMPLQKKKKVFRTGFEANSFLLQN